MPVPAGYVWALSTVGSKRHARIADSVGIHRALCVPSVWLGDEHDTPRVMNREACKRCLQRTGGAQ